MFYPFAVRLMQSHR